MNVNDCKYIIESGCSYGKVIESIFENDFFYSYIEKRYGLKNDFIDYLGNNVVLIKSARTSQSNYYIVDTIIDKVTKLLNDGVHPENIYVVSNFTEFDRVYATIPNDVLSNTDSLFVDNNSLTVIPNFDKKLLPIDPKKYTNGTTIYNNMIHIDGHLYFNPPFFESIDLPTNPFDFYIKKQQEIYHQRTFEERLKLYLDSILKVQYFLKNNNIKYNFYFINSQLSYWKITGNHNYLNNGKTSGEFSDAYRVSPTQAFYYSNFIQSKNNYNELNDLSVVVPYLKSTIDLIDFSNIWIYDEYGVRYGGIDEWTLLNCSHWGFWDTLNFTENIETSNTDKLNNFDKLNANIPQHGNHPNSIVYLMLSNKIMFNNTFTQINETYLNDLWKILKEEEKSNNTNTLFPSEGEILNKIKSYI